jgi:hypothetical protein
MNFESYDAERSVWSGLAKGALPRGVPWFMHNRQNMLEKTLSRG